MASSYIDEMMHRKGELTLTGLHWCRAGHAEWTRLPEESERRFINRAQREAKAEGFKIITFSHMQRQLAR